MSRTFNTASPCLPEDHYMLAPERRLRHARDLVHAKLYFVIHAPRQTGKTTLIRTLARDLTREGRHAAIAVSLESFTDPLPEVSLPPMLARMEPGGTDR